MYRFTWFASGHSFLAVLLSRNGAKKSIVIAGGYDVAFAPEIGYGQYTQGWNKRKYADFALKNAILVLAVSQFTKEEATARVIPKKIEVIYNAIDTDKCKPPTGRRPDQERFGFDRCFRAKKRDKAERPGHIRQGGGTPS